MSDSKLKFPKKYAGKTLREIYEKKRERSKASDALIESLAEPEEKIGKLKKICRQF